MGRPTRGRCEACGGDVLWAVYQRDVTRTVPLDLRKKARRMPFEVEPAADGDERVEHALSVGKTAAHLITPEWPLLTAQGEKRHLVHYALSPICRPAAATQGGAR